MRRIVPALLLLTSVLGIPVAGRAATPAPPPCVRRVLILGAMPLELNPFTAVAEIQRTVRVDNRTFYVGRLDGLDVVLALSGIGPVNAEQVTVAALEHFRCPFRAILFSGVAGSPANIGDVVIPQKWTLDNGKTYWGVNARMYGLARALQGTKVPLSRDLPVGDAACLCGGVDAPTPVRMPEELKVVLGGVGVTSDVFGGHAAPCTWGGGDIAGCAPCLMTGDLAHDIANFSGAEAVGTVAALPSLIAPTGTTAPPGVMAADMETAAVALVAARYRVPFLGFRAVSDGANDPLSLPGFPAQFMVYRQLAGNNAAAVTRAFLQLWKTRGLPT